MGRTRTLSLAAVMTSLAVVLRYAKNAATSFQFVNLPLAFAMLAGTYGGPLAGVLVGVTSFVVSDLLIMPGPWTVVDSVLCGALGAAWGLVKGGSKVELFVLAYLTTLAYDVASSFLLYVVFGVKPLVALAWSVVGLFLPIGGGRMVGVGPMTEAGTALLLVAVYLGLEKRGVRLWVGG